MTSSLIRTIDDLLSSAADDASRAETAGHILDAVLTHFSAAVGTVHAIDSATGMLQLVVERGVPDGVLPQVQSIPMGKGMAGLAAERREPVQVCNLQTDESGVAQPAARLTQMAGSIALPFFVGGEVRGTFGIGKPISYDYSAQEVALLESVADRLSRL